MPNQEPKKSYEFFAPKIYIRTFGCQMNVRDSEVIRGLLEKEGYSFTDEPAKADVIIFNTCSVRQHAEDKVWSEIGRLKGQSPPGTAPLMGVIGCMAQAHKEKIFERAANVSFVVGPSDIAKLPGIINKLRNKETLGTVPMQLKIWETDGTIRPDEIYRTGFYEDKSHAYVVISEGCSNFCSYCVVPYVRSALRNRKIQDILREITEAVDKGIKNITLLGQNVNAYRDEGGDFIQLLSKVNDIGGLEEFSFVTSHPKDISSGLFREMADLEKLKKHLHLPVQSGSNRILGLMNRGYTRESYLDLVDKYRKGLKKGTLSSDIIVGFPSETETDFKDTFDLVMNARFDAAYIFKYSPRPHTQAQNIPDDVERKEKERRHKLILDLQISIAKNKKC